MEMPLRICLTRLEKVCCVNPPRLTAMLRTTCHRIDDRTALRASAASNLGSFARRSACAAVSLALTWFAPAARLFGADAAGATDRASTVVLTVEGRVESARRATQQWSLAKTNQPLEVGDRLRTGFRSRATLRLSDLSVLRVNELTTLEIQPAQALGAKPGLDLRSGAIYFFNRERPGEVQFRTPLASGAIRGTEFNLAVAENGATVVTMFDGEVAMTAGQDLLTLQSGEQGIIEPGQPPRKTTAVEAINIIQWVLFYPAVIDPGDLALTEAEKQALADSLAAYRVGDLLKALEAYPADRLPASDAERVYRAAVFLAAGQVQQTEAALRALAASAPLSQALREVVAAVKGLPVLQLPPPTAGSEWLARSYYEQSRSELEKARDTARQATQKSPEFGAAWVRLAEMEFSFGRNREALQALDKGLQLSPRNAQGVALLGFLLCDQRKFTAAFEQFDKAIAIDGGLGNAWLGRGLLEIRLGQGAQGRADLQVAAALEPQRSILRSYLGKAWDYTRDWRRAEKELKLAERLDPNDPTPWLYSALLNQQQNRINQAVRDLEKSKELNDNRSVYRSQLLLDQDRAVRSANLASIYRDAGMEDVSLREASRAVTYDYANYSAHLFLAESYAAYRDPRTINLRYETPFFSELLVSQLLAPIGAGNLSQYISQQEYTRLFEGDKQGLFSSTWYDSSGDWVEEFSQYGTVKDFMYSVDLFARSQDGWRPNNDLDQIEVSTRFKQQLTPQDSLFFQASFYNAQSGDILQYYNQGQANLGLRVEEDQNPNLYLGYHHEWAPGVHTLFLGAWLNDELQATNPFAPIFTLNGSAAGQVTNVVQSWPYQLDTNGHPVNVNAAFGNGYESKFAVYSAELQQIFQRSIHTLVAGVRVQVGDVDTKDLLTPKPANRGGTGNAWLANYYNPAALTNTSSNLDRYEGYAYYTLQVADPLQLTAGLSYDYLNYPANTDYSPISSGQTHKDQWSPKAGLIWTPGRNTVVRFAYTRSLGGLFYDNSVRLEPTQVAGFTQAYRSLVPESVVGPVPGSSFTTYGVGLDHRFPTWTYVGVYGEILQSEADRTIGAFDMTGPLLIVRPPPPPAVPGSMSESLDYDERSLHVNVNQLIGQEWALGARYRLTYAELDDQFTQLPAGTANNPSRDVNATLQQLNLYVRYNHPCGFFGQFDSIWTHQSSEGYSPDLATEDFWEFNVWVGYRLWQRRVEARFGVLNLTDQDYQLNPLTFYLELPRERLYAAALKLNF
jgi:Tfp pilus assembly protein PilF